MEYDLKNMHPGQIESTSRRIVPKLTTGDKIILDHKYSITFNNQTPEIILREIASYVCYFLIARLTKV